jgi:hypothetical protein
MHYILKELPCTKLTTVHQFTYTDNIALSYFENKIHNNTGINDGKTNVKGKMTDWFLFSKDPEFNSFIQNVFFPNTAKHVNVLIPIDSSGIIIKEAWGNILDTGNFVERHNHVDTEYTTVIYFDSIAPLHTEIGVFDTYRGMVLTLESFIDHWVEPVPSKRTSLIFNWSPKGEWTK